MATQGNYRGIILTVLAISAIGALNWGLIGFFNFNLVDAIFGGGYAEETSTLSRVIYALVGLAGIAAFAVMPRIRGSSQKPSATGQASRMGA